MTIESTILWRRIDAPGHEAARILRFDSGWRLEGHATFAHERQPCSLDYAVVCDAKWRTESAEVFGWVGTRPIHVSIAVDPVGIWFLNGTQSPQVTGAIDVDLNFSPSTNALPIRRLRLAVGEEASVRAAWLRFPSFALEPLEQLYRRTSEDTYRYESAGGKFVADLKVNPSALPLTYENLWVAEA